MEVVGWNRAIIWDQIELSERYLVSGMYDEATSISSSILKDLCCKTLVTEETQQLSDMLESAGMVLVQASKELGRTRDTLNELLQLFGSITAIPIQVFLAGVCFQLSEGISQDTRRLVEEFLSKWKYVNDRYVIPATAESNAIFNGGCKIVVRVEEYLEVVEVYVLALVGVGMKDVDSAVSWVEKASLPEDKRKDLLRKLQFLYSHKALGQAQDCVPSPTNGRYQAQSHYLEEQQQPPKGSEEPFKAQYATSRKDNTKESILKLLRQRGGNIWWFRNFTLKLGNRRLAISNGKLVMGCLMVFIYYILKRKRISLKENIKRRSLSVKKGLVELWELAFSYQVNPLAALQPISSATRGSR